VWIVGLDDERDTALSDYLSRDFSSQLVEVPGVGYFLMPGDLEPGTPAYTALKTQVLRAALADEPNDDLFAALALTYAAEAGDLAQAEKVFARWEEFGGDATARALAQGEIYSAAAGHPDNAGQSVQLLEQAATCYQRSLATAGDADRSIIARRLADTYTRLGDRAAAASVLERTYWQDKAADDQVAATLGDLAYADKDYSRALEWYDRLQKPDHTMRMKHGETLERVGDRQGALAAYEAAASARPDLARPVIHAALLYAAVKDDAGYRRSLTQLSARMAKMTTRHRARVKQTPEYQRLMQVKDNTP
jgi:hypothetical protein